MKLFYPWRVYFNNGWRYYPHLPYYFNKRNLFYHSSRNVWTLKTTPWKRIQIWKKRNDSKFYSVGITYVRVNVEQHVSKLQKRYHACFEQKQWKFPSFPQLFCSVFERKKYSPWGKLSTCKKLEYSSTCIQVFKNRPGYNACVRLCTTLPTSRFMALSPTLLQMQSGDSALLALLLHYFTF